MERKKLDAEIAVVARTLALDPAAGALDMARRWLSKDVGHRLNRLSNRLVLQGTVLPGLHRLDAAGIDLRPGAVERATLSRARLLRIMPHLAADERVTLTDLLESLEKHQRFLRETLCDLAHSVPARFVPGWGLAQQLAFPTPSPRQSSDVDLIAAADGSADRIAAHLVSRRGFRPRSTAQGRGSGADLAWRSYSRTTDGHMIKVDVFDGGLPSARHSWLPPFRSPELFSRALPESVDGVLLLVPSKADLLVMAAEKGLRTAFTFTDRRIGDVSALVDLPDVRWDVVVAEAQRHRVSAALHWLVSKAPRGPNRVPSAVMDALQPNLWERWVMAVMAQETPLHGRARRSVQTIHRWQWVAHYVRTTPGWYDPLSEIIGGRLVRPQRLQSH